jgi:hypothetical protein
MIDRSTLIKTYPFSFAVSSVTLEDAGIRVDILRFIYFLPRSAETDFPKESLVDASLASSHCHGRGLKGVHCHQVLVR